MTQPVITIATRESPMAMWQAEYVKAQLSQRHPDIEFRLLGMTTHGDQDTKTPLLELGGKSVFVKELQQALLDKRADIAVHSIKDMSVHAVNGLCLSAICQRTEVRDAFISNHYASLADLPNGAIVGTGSPRRWCQLKALRPDIEIKPIRGNAGTRLQKLDDGQYDAILLSAAGLERLGLTERIRSYFDPDRFIPAIGQGAIGLECRSGDPDTCAIAETLNDPDTNCCISAERALNQRLSGDCHTPIGAYATLDDNNTLTLKTIVGTLDGGTIIYGQGQGPRENAQLIGIQVANDLLAKGAGDML
jgi:hydroxymethylbilane synthase